MSGIGTATPGRTAPRRALPPLSAAATGGYGDRPVRRVRHEVRDGVAVVLFSAAASTGVAVLLTLLARLGN
jgi:hypothetical protein